MIVNRFEIWLVNLNPIIGSEITKTRPCVIVSPNEMNKYLQTVLLAPLTHTKKMYPSRIDCILNN
jgi:mRNA interferase MazF